MSAVLVAGGATGIGRATVHALRASGVDVYLADINLDAAVEAATGEDGGRVVVGKHDLAEPDAPGDAVTAALAEFGRLDGIVVTVGLHVVAPVEEFAIEDWDRTMAINVRAPFLFAQTGAGPLAETGGSIVLTSSTAAFRGSRGTFAYAASKGALVSLTRSLAVELAPRGVRVNCVCPGWIDTPFNDPYWSLQADPERALAELASRIPAGRQGEPVDVAGMIVYLLGSGAAYVTGQSIIVDGGLLSA
jgi:NAD(P)-dependent dehydrogenase (short-subunit alcohol dehydrogenase family)